MPANRAAPDVPNAVTGMDPSGVPDPDDQSRVKFTVRLPSSTMDRLVAGELPERLVKYDALTEPYIDTRTDRSISLPAEEHARLVIRARAAGLPVNRFLDRLLSDRRCRPEQKVDLGLVGPDGNIEPLPVKNSDGTPLIAWHFDPDGSPNRNSFSIGIEKTTPLPRNPDPADLLAINGNVALCDIYQKVGTDMIDTYFVWNDRTEIIAHDASDTLVNPETGIICRRPDINGMNAYHLRVRSGFYMYVPPAAWNKAKHAGYFITDRAFPGATSLHVRGHVVILARTLTATGDVMPLTQVDGVPPDARVITPTAPQGLPPAPTGLRKSPLEFHSGGTGPNPDNLPARPIYDPNPSFIKWELTQDPACGLTIIEWAKNRIIPIPTVEDIDEANVHMIGSLAVDTLQDNVQKTLFVNYNGTAKGWVAMPIEALNCLEHANTKRPRHIAAMVIASDLKVEVQVFPNGSYRIRGPRTANWTSGPLSRVP